MNSDSCLSPSDTPSCSGSPAAYHRSNLPDRQSRRCCPVHTATESTTIILALSLQQAQRTIDNSFRKGRRGREEGDLGIPEKYATTQTNVPPHARPSFPDDTHTPETGPSACCPPAHCTRQWHNPPSDTQRAHSVPDKLSSSAVYSTPEGWKRNYRCKARRRGWFGNRCSELRSCHGGGIAS